MARQLGRKDSSRGKSTNNNGNMTEPKIIYWKEKLLMVLIFVLGASSGILFYHCYSPVHSNLHPLSSDHSHVNNPTKPPVQPTERLYRPVSGSARSRVVTVHTHFIPPRPASFQRFLASEASRSALSGVLGWRSASASWGWVPEEAFSVLLPPSPPVITGHVWRILTDHVGSEFMYSDVHTPPVPSGPVEELLLHLLSLFHPQPFLESRYSPRGAAAVVRAKNGDLLDIIFRVHAEFQLNPPSHRPLWFSPAAFLGRLVIDSNLGHVRHFSLHVPTETHLNLNLEWLTGSDETQDVEVTITHLPLMSLTSTPHISRSSQSSKMSGTSEKPDLSTANMPEVSNVPGTFKNPDLSTYDKHDAGYTWTEEIPVDVAQKLLVQEMYRFTKVEYHNFSTAYRLASEVRRPLHVVVAWGSLGSQAC